MRNASVAFFKRAYFLAGIVGLGLCLGSLAAAEPFAVPRAFDKQTPENVDDLLQIQKHVHEVLKKVVPCTVGLRIGNSSGSGIIVSEDGKVLTAGHVSGDADRKVKVILPDGREVNGKTLGANRGIDSGMVQITAPGPWPFVEMGKSADLQRGQWCLAIGHPGGFKAGRTPVVRLGRVLENTAKLVRTDCTLVGGDSGGPLLDMHGRVIAIHSRIGKSLAVNIHVPVDTYRDTWDQLAGGEVWGEMPGRRAYMGIELEPANGGLRIAKVASDSPAQKAGLKSDDILLAFAGKRIESLSELQDLLSEHRPGNRMNLEVRRGAETITIRIVLGRKPADLEP